MLTLLPKGVQTKNFSYWRYFPFATGVNDTGGDPWAANISANYNIEKIQNDPKPEVENLVTLFL